MASKHATYENLFGETVAVPDDAVITKKGKRSNKVGGYAGNPGSGPDGETCKTCKHAHCLRGWSKNYWKCELLRAHWTRGPGSDIRLKSPACLHFEPKEDK